MLTGVRCLFSPPFTVKLPLKHQTLKAKWLKTPSPLLLLIHCLLFDILLSKALEFSSGLSGWQGPIGLEEMKCYIAGFEISSHAQKTKCFSHWSFFQDIIDDSKFSISSIIKKKRQKYFSCVVTWRD